MSDAPDTEDRSLAAKACPYRGCDWSKTFDPSSNASRIAAEVDAEIHFDTEHGGKVPEDAEFGDKQCPECWAMDGMNGSVSCSDCGHIPEEVRECAE